jgi:histidine triad (HIT) family protein
MAYDSGNIFARILRGELPAHKVYEDADTLAFMDIMPRCQGHTLVVPKAPARNILDASPEQMAACMRTVQTM